MSVKAKTIQLFLLLGLSTAIAACGGGGEAEDTEVPATSEGDEAGDGGEEEDEENGDD